MLSYGSWLQIADFGLSRVMVEASISTGTYGTVTHSARPIHTPPMCTPLRQNSPSSSHRLPEHGRSEISPSDAAPLEEPVSSVNPQHRPWRIPSHLIFSHLNRHLFVPGFSATPAIEEEPSAAAVHHPLRPPQPLRRPPLCRWRPTFNTPS